MDKLDKICGNCGWYESHHINAGFCTHPSKFLVNINSEVFVGINKKGCNKLKLKIRNN